MRQVAGFQCLSLLRQSGEGFLAGHLHHFRGHRRTWAHPLQALDDDRVVLVQAAGAADGDGPVPHPRQGRQRDVFSIVANVLVDLVRKTQCVKLFAKLGDEF
mgnify:CR=1 FL=1